MEELRSKSCGDGRTETEEKQNPSTLQDLRSYSVSSSSYAQSKTTTETQIQISNSNSKEVRFNKKVVGKSNGSLTKNWSLNDPELKRKKRVAGYKVYSVEGKVKGSIRKSFRWLKDIFVYGGGGVS